MGRKPAAGSSALRPSRNYPPPPPPQPNRAGSLAQRCRHPARMACRPARRRESSASRWPIRPRAKAAKPATDPAVKTAAPRDTRRYIPSGAFTRALLLGGLDAPTGGQAQRNPQPVLLRLMDNAVLPNQFRSKVKECFVVGAGYGDVSSERAYIRTESLSCITRDGTAIDVPVKGYVAGEDGKAGMRGRLVSKQGQILANALLAGVASGIGQAFTQSSTTMSISPLGTTSTVDPAKQLEAGLGTGVGKALDRLAQYYITLAEKVFPVIEIDAGRTVDVVLTQGIALQGHWTPPRRTPRPIRDSQHAANQRRRSEDDDE
jgi:conjugal transfer pilus assembly protein TraB